MDNILQVAAVVAAAGRSQRMGTSKGLLPWGSSTVLAAVVESLTAAGARPVLCVLGHAADKMEAALRQTDAISIYNAQYGTGEMLSSFQVGVAALEAESGVVGTLLALGDQPHIGPALIRRVLGAAVQRSDAIVIPSYANRRGHPYYLPRRLWPELLALGTDATPRDLLQQHAEEIVYVAVDSDAILRDMDTFGEYTALWAAAEASGPEEGQER